LVINKLTLFVSLPTRPNQVANKAYVDSKVNSDVAFLMKKEFESALVSDEGFLSAIGDLASLTASAGKTMYLASAKITYFSNTNLNTGAVGNCQVVLKINDVIIETTNFSTGVASGSGVGGDPVNVYEFKNIGRSVAATEIIKLEVISLDAAIDVEGFIECVEVDTGVDPTS